MADKQKSEDCLKVVMSVELSVVTNVAEPKQSKAVSTVDGSALCYVLLGTLDSSPVWI